MCRINALRSASVLALVSALASSAEAATVRVQGNQTSRVIASGDTLVGERQGQDVTEHPGSTGLVAASPAGALLSQDLSAAAPGSGAELHLLGSAHLGSLAITGSATAFAAPPQGVTAHASGGIAAEWRAELTIFGGPGLSTGSAVDMLATVEVHADGSLNFGNNSLRANFNFPNLGPNFRLACNDFNASCNGSETIALRGRVGTTYALSGDMSLVILTSASASQEVYDGHSSVNAGNTSRLYLDVLTPGASYLLDDGSVFPTTIPEPASGLSLFCS